MLVVRHLILCFFFFFFFFSGSSWAASDNARIAVIHSYPPGEWFHSIQETLESTARARSLGLHFEPIVFHAEYWLRRPPEELGRERDRILTKISETGAEAVVICDDEAADVFAREVHRKGLPAFLTGINREASELPWWPTIQSRAAIVFERYPVLPLLRGARRIFPDARTIAIVSSKNPTSEIILPRLQKEMKSADIVSIPDPFRIVDTFKSDDWQAWKNHLASIGDKADLAWIVVPYDVRDLHGAEVPIVRIGRWMRDRLRIPSLGLSSVHPKMGVLLTVAVTPAQLARATVEQLQAWRSGVPFSGIGAQSESQGQLHINLGTAKRLGARIPSELLSVSKIVPEVSLPYGR